MLGTEDGSPGTADPRAALTEAFSLVRAGAAVRAISSLILTGSLLTTTVLLVRMLDRSSYGVLALGLAATALATALTSMGLAPATTRTVSEHVVSGDRDGLLGVALGVQAWVLLGGAIGLVLIVVLMVVTQGQLSMTQRLVVGGGLGMLVIGRSSAVAAGAFALGFGRVVLMDTPTVFANLSQLLVTVLLLILGIHRVETVAVSFGAIATLTAALSWWITLRIAQRGRRPLREYVTSVVWLSRVVAPYALGGIAVQVIASFDVFILGLTHSSRVVGAYEPVVLGVSRLMALLPVLLLAAYIPAATRLVSLGHREAFADLYLSIGKVRYVIAFPVIVLLAVAPVTIFHVVFGHGFPVSSSVVYILLIGSSLDLACGLNGQALVASGDRRRMAWASVWPSVGMVVLCFVLIPFFGALGAAWATSGAIIVLNVSMSWGLYRATGVHPIHKDFLLVVFLSFVALGVAFSVTAVFGSGLAVAVFATVCGWIVWIGVLRLLSAISLSEFIAVLSRTRHPQSS